MYMTTKRRAVGKAATKIADILIDHMEETMTPAEARAMRGDLHKLAVKSNSPAVRFKMRT